MDLKTYSRRFDREYVRESSSLMKGDYASR